MGFHYICGTLVPCFLAIVVSKGNSAILLLGWFSDLFYRLCLLTQYVYRKKHIQIYNINKLYKNNSIYKYIKKCNKL